MAAKYGCLEEFRLESDSIRAYLERADLYFQANGIGENKRVPILLSSIGASTYALLRDLVAPDAPGTLEFRRLSEVLIAHFEPKRMVIAERFYFHKRAQAVGESIADFDAALRKLALHCEFGATLEESLRDRFVCGLQHESTQRRLLSEPALTYQKALDIAKAMETADSNTKSFKDPEPPIRKVYSQIPRSEDSRLCRSCGRKNHAREECRFRDATCYACGKRGHIAPACKSAPAQKVRSKKSNSRKSYRETAKTYRLDDKRSHSFEDSSSDEYELHHMGKRSTEPVQVQMTVNGKKLDMEVDTGAALSLISDSKRKAMFPKEKLRPASIILKTYTNEPIKVMGTLNVRVQYEGQLKKLVLVVIAGKGPSLLGRNWLNHIALNWKKVFAVRTLRLESLNKLMQRHKSLFSEGLGTIEPYRATLHIQPGAKPRFFKPRSVPFAIRGALGSELDRLEQQGVLVKTSSSDWAAPIVAVPKKDGKFRICGDYKVTINQALNVEQYPLPKPEELFSTLAKGKVFSKLDLSQAYLQLRLDEPSMQYVTINTHKGLYTPTRLPFGVASAPAIFQKIMDTILQGLPKVICYIDDILVSGEDEASHFQSLEEVFNRLEKHGIRLKQEKCCFLLPRVEYLGHQISEEGIQPLANKVSAIIEAPTPKDLQQLRSFLGLVNYYGKFIPNLATLLQPLHSLLQTDTKWVWSQKCARAFQEAKEKIASAQVLTHYDPARPIKLAVDASPYGVGAVISHSMPNGDEKPIAFASRTLHKGEKNYAQIEKEALAIVYGVKKFHQYLYGRKFVLLTDHQPLTSIFGPKKGIPSLAAARLQRWAILLSAYNYEICYKPTKEQCNADGLSRLPLPTKERLQGEEGVSVFNIGQFQALPVTFKEIRTATRRDSILSKVVNYVLKGWPKQSSEELRHHFRRKEEYTMENGCLLWGARVVIPKSLQGLLLQSLHENHPGITRMKAIARSYFWWTGLDQAIEEVGKSCEACQANQPNPPAAPLHPWVWPDAPWTRIHIDYAGPFLGKMFFVVVDAHSKWPEVAIMSTSSTTLKTIDILRSLFARYGLPEQLVSDNGPQFTSNEFGQFVRANGIRHIKSAPYHPASNGQVERFIRTMKRSLRASEKDGRSLQHNLAEFLFTYRTTAHATTNATPSKLFLGRNPRTRFDFLRKRTKEAVRESQAEQKEIFDRRTRNRCFFPGAPVFVRDYRGESKWIAGTVLRKLGPVTFQVDVGKGQVWKRHLDQLRHRGGEIQQSAIPSAGPTKSTSDDYDFCPFERDNPPPERDVARGVDQPRDPPPDRQPSPARERPYPRRERHPPERYGRPFCW